MYLYDLFTIILHKLFGNLMIGEILLLKDCFFIEKENFKYLFKVSLG